MRTPFQAWAKPAVAGPKRFVCVGTYLGFFQRDFFPEKTGRDYSMPFLLEPLGEFRDQMTVFSGLDHRGRNGHEGWKAWMTGSATGSISLDQLIAAKVGAATRLDSLQVTCGTPPGAAKLSFTEEGVALPMIGRPSVLYKTLFQSSTDKKRLEAVLSSNQSILDSLLDESKRLEKRLGVEDKKKFVEYLASIRAVEKRLQKQRLWLDRPQAVVDLKLPTFDPVAPDLALECESLMYELMALALETDTTRVISFMVPGWSQVFTIDGQRLSAGYHGLSHHGNDPAKIREYNLVGRAHVQRFADFVGRLARVNVSGGGNLLDETIVLFGSGMGDSNTHDNSHLPTAVFGGGLHHGKHHRLDRGQTDRRLGDLYLSLLQRFGIDRGSFAGATSNLNELI